MSETFYRPTHVRIRLESRNSDDGERATATGSSKVTVNDPDGTAIATATAKAFSAVTDGHAAGDLEYFYDTDDDAGNGTYKAVTTTINGDNSRDTTTVWEFIVADP